MAQSVLSSKGQMIIPKEIREALHLKRGTRLSVELEETRIIVRVAPDKPIDSISTWRGRFKGTSILEEHCEEHAREVNDERLP